MQRIAMKGAAAFPGILTRSQPRLIGKIDRVDDQGISIPFRNRISHPGWVRIGVMRSSICRYDTEGGVSFIKDDQLSRQLHQPRRMRPAPDARYAVRLAMQQWISVLSITQLSGLQSRPWLIRQLIGWVGSRAGSHAGFGFSGSRIGSQRSVFLNPHPRKVRMSIRRSRRRLGMILR